MPKFLLVELTRHQCPNEFRNLPLSVAVRIVCAMVVAGGNRSVMLQVERQVVDPGRTAEAATREAVLIGNDLEVRHVQFDDAGDSVLAAKDQLLWLKS